MPHSRLDVKQKLSEVTLGETGGFNHRIRYTGPALMLEMKKGAAFFITLRPFCGNGTAKQAVSRVL